VRSTISQRALLFAGDVRMTDSGIIITSTYTVCFSSFLIYSHAHWGIYLPQNKNQCACWNYPYSTPAHPEHSHNPSPPFYMYSDYEYNMNQGTNRANIKEGLKVGIILKPDQKSGKITQGIVKRILTNSSNHPHGIKVQLENGQVGRVKEIHQK